MITDRGTRPETRPQEDPEQAIRTGEPQEEEGIRGRPGEPVSVL